jgi:TonB family protein
MKKTTHSLFLAIVCVSIFFVSCKNDTKTASSNTVQGDASAVKAAADAAAKATADSMAMAETAALAAAKEDSITKATAAAEAAAKGKQAKTTPKVVIKPTAKPATKPTPKTPTTTTLPKKPTTAPTTTPTTKDGNVKKRTGKDDVIVIAEVKPVYPGGEGAMMNYLKSNIKYPMKAKEEGIKGTVYVQFVIEKDGSVAEVVVAKGINPLLDTEAKRVVSSMPKWAAGKQANKAVAVQYTLPVRFDLIE